MTRKRRSSDVPLQAPPRPSWTTSSANANAVVRPTTSASASIRRTSQPRRFGIEVTERRRRSGRRSSWPVRAPRRAWTRLPSSIPSGDPLLRARVAACSVLVEAAVVVVLRLVDARRDEPEDAGRTRVEDTPQLLEHRPVRELEIRDDDERVHGRAQGPGVADRKQRRRVDEHEVDTLLECLEHVLDGPRADELAAVERSR